MIRDLAGNNPVILRVYFRLTIRQPVSQTISQSVSQSTVSQSISQSTMLGSCLMCMHMNIACLLLDPHTDFSTNYRL